VIPVVCALISLARGAQSVRDMRTTQLALLLLALTRVGVASADDNHALRVQVRSFRDRAGAFSVTMGSEAVKTAALAERALHGMNLGEGAALDMKKDAHEVTRMWRLDQEGNRLEANRIASVGRGFEQESFFNRSMNLEHTDGRISGARSVASYNPRGTEGKTWKIEQVEARVMPGVYLGKREVQRQTVEGGKLHIEVRAVKHTLSVGPFAVSLQKAVRR
jgi:hypothetical protein